MLKKKLYHDSTYTHCTAFIFNIKFLGLPFTHKYKIQNRKRRFSKVEKETEEETVWKSRRRRLGYLTLNARIVSCFG